MLTLAFRSHHRRASSTAAFVGLRLAVWVGIASCPALSAGHAFPPGGPIYAVDFWREAEGLPQSRIRAIVQTHDGYVWLGTDGGAVRFNGSTFRAFTVETGN